MCSNTNPLTPVDLGGSMPVDPMSGAAAGGLQNYGQAPELDLRYPWVLTSTFNPMMMGPPADGVHPNAVSECSCTWVNTIPLVSVVWQQQLLQHSPSLPQSPALVSLLMHVPCVCLSKDAVDATCTPKLTLHCSLLLSRGLCWMHLLLPPATATCYCHLLLLLLLPPAATGRPHHQQGHCCGPGLLLQP
jgi:hypothetical protein